MNGSAALPGGGGATRLVGADGPLQGVAGGGHVGPLRRAVVLNRLGLVGLLPGPSAAAFWL
jgi:hypothetical protein